MTKPERRKHPGMLRKLNRRGLTLLLFFFPILFLSKVIHLFDAIFYVYKYFSKDKCLTLPKYVLCSVCVMTHCRWHHGKECCLFVHWNCDGIIDMHFILLVYKHKYMTNKISHFLQMASHVTEEQHCIKYRYIEYEKIIFH